MRCGENEMEEFSGGYEELKSKSAMKRNPLQKIGGDFETKKRLLKTLSGLFTGFGLVASSTWFGFSY